MKPAISEQAIRLATTSKALSETDKNVIRAICAFNSRWVSVQDLLAAGCLLRGRDELLLWLRQQSVNNITQIGEKRLVGFPIVQTWMHDPIKDTVFFTFSRYLFDSLESVER